MSLPEPQSTTRGGVTLRFVDAGDGDPPFVFVHGWGCSHLHFVPQLKHFAAHHRVIGVDQRGHGASEAPHEEITVEVLAEDLASLCRELEVERPILVGHSMGAAVVLGAVAHHPGLARGIAMVDPAVLFHERAAPGLEEFVERLTLHGWRQTVRNFADRVFFEKGDTSDLRRWIVGELTKTRRRVLHTAFRNMLAFDAEPALRKLELPLLLIDPPRPVGDRDRLRAAYPALIEERVDGVAHFLQLEAPEAVNAALERFAARC